MPIYYFFQRNNFRAGQPVLLSLECALDRWADVRTKMEEMLGVSRFVQNLGRKTEPASLMGCVVGNKLSHHDWEKLRHRSHLLPALENGSLLVDGDTIIVAVVSQRLTLHYQDIWHRCWIFNLMKRHFALKGEEQEFERDVRRYDLRTLICRVIALSEQKANPTINLKQKNQILKIAFEKSVERFDQSYTHDSLFEFGLSYQPCFGHELYKKMCYDLRNTNIDVNRRTKFLSKLIRESGGELECGESIAKRLGIEDIHLVQLVRDSLHNYEPQYVAKEKVDDLFAMEEEEEEEEDDDDEEKKEGEVDAKRRKIIDEGLESILAEEEKLAKAALAATPAVLPEDGKAVAAEPVVTEPVVIEPVVTESDENTKIQKVIESANDSSTAEKQPIFNMHVYCLCCDVPGHHTNMCPRLEFLENLRTTCHHGGAIPWSIFYAPENGICPIPFSILSKFVSQHFPSKAGEINRKKIKTTILDEFILPPVPYYTNTRWIVDAT